MHNRKEFFSVIKEEGTRVEAEEARRLSDYGFVIRSELFSLLTDQALGLDQDLLETLSTSFLAYPDAVFDQLGFLLEKPLFKTQDSQNGHWSYELTMSKTVLNFAEAIKTKFSGNNQLIADLVFMITVSDIGKSGPRVVEADHYSAVVRKMYNHCIFGPEHKTWLMKCNPADFPVELQQALANISRDDSAGISDYDLIFSNGVFFALPIEVYFYVLKQVALKKITDDPQLLQQDPDLVIKIEETFTLKPEERAFLKLMDSDPQSMPIRRFFTRSHILFGSLFLKQPGLLNLEQQALVPLAMSHHFSQKILPLDLDIETVINDELWVKKCAFLEVLDKFSAYFSRWHGAQGEIPIQSINSTKNEIRDHLDKNYSDQPQIKIWYEEIISWMEETEIFTQFGK